MNHRFLLILLCLWASLSTAQTDTLIPRSLFFGARDMQRIQLSKDGERVYYQRESLGNQTLCYREVARPAEEQRLRFAAAVLDWAVTYDNELLLLTLDAGNLRKLILAGADGKVIRDLTPFPIRNLRIEALSRGRADAAAVWLIAEDAARDGTYVINLKKGTGERISPRLGFSSRYYDGDLRLAAAVRDNAAGGRAVFIREGEGWRELVQYGFDGGAYIGGLQQVVSVSEDGKRLYLTDDRESDKTVLVEYRLDTLKRRVLVADPRTDILPFEALVGPDGWPQMVLGMWGQPLRHYLNGETRRDFEWLDQQLGAQVSFTGRSADNRIWLVRRLDGGPARYFLFRRARRELIPLFSDYPLLDSVALASRRTFEVRMRDGLVLPLQVYLPPGSDQDRNGVPDTLLPTVVYVHDGPRDGVVHWNSWFHTRNFQLLANRGYAVISIEFRGVPGYGREVAQLGDGQWGGGMHTDLLDVAGWAVRQRIADGKRLAVWGWSYGGYAASAALAFAPERFACGLSMSGPADLEAFLRTAAANASNWRAAVGDPGAAGGVARLRAQSPFHHREKITRPLLLTAGGLDERVPRVQVDTFATALAEAGKKVVYFYYPEEGHDIQAAGSWISFWAIAERFLHEHLRGRYEPAGEDLKKGNLTVVHGREYVEGAQ